MTGGLQRAPLTRGKRKVRRKIPIAVRNAVKARSHGRCVVCLHRLAAAGVLNRERASRVAQLHHVWPVRLFPELEVEPWNLVGLCVGCHDEHERAHRRVPRDALPSETIALSQWPGAPADPAVYGVRLSYLERTYPLKDPAAGEPRQHDRKGTTDG